MPTSEELAATNFLPPGIHTFMSSSCAGYTIMSTTYVSSIH